MALFDKFRRKETGRAPGQPPEAPRGQRIYAIGDIHGRADLLEQLHRQIEDDAAGFDGAKRVVYLGDMIDRGNHSREVIDLLLEQPLQGFEPVYLMGNHEHALLSFLDNPQSIAGWLGWGGRETLQSYGVESRFTDDLDALREKLAASPVAGHLDFYRGCELYHQEGDYYFVHAGVRPGIRLEEQRFEDQLWIREPFISSTSDHGAVVVHGHTISEEPQRLPNRIGIDTGAFYSGRLTCLVLEGPEQRFLQTGGSK